MSVTSRITALAHDCQLSREARDHALLAAPAPLDAETGWTASGCRELTAEGASPPGDVAGRADAAAAVAQSAARSLGAEISCDGAAQLSLRAKLSADRDAPLAGRSLRGAARLLRSRDGWLALNLARESDVEALPALAARDLDPGDDEAITEWAGQQRVDDIVDRAVLLDLPAARVATERPSGRPVRPFTLSAQHQAATPPLSELRVADLSSLWAGPLVGALLAAAGAQVEKITSHTRPENPLPRDTDFYRQLNKNKTEIELDFSDTQALARHLARADVVITSARPRALSRLGLTPRLGQRWVRITAHGHEAEHASRVGFGDDCAAAAGAIGWAAGEPVFAGDALADPITGLLGAAAVFGMLESRTAGVINLNLVRSSQWAIQDAT